MRILFTLLFVLIAAGTSALQAQVDAKQRPTLAGSNAEGLRFVVGFMQNEADDGGICGRQVNTLLISISSRYDASLRILFPNGQTIDTSVKAFGVTTIDVSMSTIEEFECFGEGVFRKAIEVLADRPVSVTSYNSRPATSDGYLALPVSSWGTDYVTACYYVDHYTGDDSTWGGYCAQMPRPGELAVLAAEDSTFVTVYPKARTLRGVAAGAPYVRMLNRGEIFQVQDGGSVRRYGANPGTDLTGSRVVASKPVGVLSGHVRTAVPTIYETKDHLVEMMPPVPTLGLRHMLAPFNKRQGGDVVRVISTSPSTGFTVTAVSKGTETHQILGAGDFVDVDIVDATAIDANAPVLVVQYARSSDADPRNIGRDPRVIHFDPDMVVITPEEQFVNSAVFQTLPSRGQFDRHAVTVIVQKDAFATLRLNGGLVRDLDSLQWGDIPSRPYVWATFDVAGARTYTLDSKGLFGGYLFGTGNVDSYAWPIGSGLRRSIPDEDIPQLLSEPDCGGYRIIALDSGMLQRGLAEVILDTAVSVNALLEGPTIPIGADMAVLRVRQINPALPAVARIIARDLARNEASIEVRIEPSAVVVDPMDIDLGLVDIGRLYTTEVVVRNPGGRAVTLDSAVLVNRLSFQLPGAIRNIALPTDGEYRITVRFQIGVKRTATDTLVLYIDCREYRVPLIARSDVPGIATRDLDFGRVRVGRERRMMLGVRNTGYATLRVDSAIGSGAPFGITSAPAYPVSISPGDSATLEVAFRPMRIGPAGGSIRFFSNVEDSVAVANLSGVGIYPNLWISDYDFGQVQVGDTACARVFVVNTGTDTATVTALDVRTPAGFIVGDTVFPRRLAPGDTLFIPLCFAPSEEAAYTSDILPRNEDDLVAMNAIRGRGYRLVASISGADMGRRRLYTTHDSVVYVSNHSTEPITVTRVWIEGGDAGDFYARPLDQPITLAQGESQPVQVSFSPLQAGHRSCFIHAATTSRERPVVDSVLWGFGLIPLTSSRLSFDSSLAYACRNRSGMVVIYNDGNIPLTFESITSGATGGALVVNAPARGYQIAVGDSIMLDFRFTLSGYVGLTAGFIEWRFAEMLDSVPGRFDFAFSSAPQFYTIDLSAPARAAVGGAFKLVVTVDSAYWQSVLERELELRLRFDPMVLAFDHAAWAAADDGVSEWAPDRVRTIGAGDVVLTFVPRSGPPLPIAGLELPPIPMRAFLGSSIADTIEVTMTAVGNTCAQPTAAMSPIALDSICGLSDRLLEFTGDPFALSAAKPNPASTSATVTFTIPTDAQSRLELYSADGQLVRTLLESSMKSGDYSVVIPVEDLPSGLYYYRLTSGGLTAARSMQVTK